VKVHNLLVCLLISLTAGVSAEEPTTGPLIDGYGLSYSVDERDVALPDGFVYKTVFDIGQDPKPGEVNRHLVTVARFLNMHARNGVKTENMILAVVVHGAATRNLVAAEDNPNLELLGKLQEAGVQVYLCGQSMVHSGIQKDQLASGVQVGLSAMTQLTILQASGHALIPWGA
jgi:intracellular sulfur oxidation DsrE/DsrF family protein